MIHNHIRKHLLGKGKRGSDILLKHTVKAETIVVFEIQ